MSENKSNIENVTDVLEAIDNDPTKPWYASRTVWGALVSLASTLLILTGQVGLTPTAQNGLIELLTVLGSSGALAAIFGRIYATTRIGTPAPTAPTPPTTTQ
jgi:hypothetical protein